MNWKYASIPVCLAMLVGCATQQPAPNMSITLDGAEVVYGDAGGSYMKLLGVSGRGLYPAPERLLPLDNKVKRLLALGIKGGTPTKCILSQDSGTLLRKLIIVDVGNKTDDLVNGSIVKLDLGGKNAPQLEATTEFENGAIHILHGTIHMGGFTFTSQSTNPLVFRVDYGKGYVYVKGVGTVRDSAGIVTTLGTTKTEYVAGTAIK